MKKAILSLPIVSVLAGGGYWIWPPRCGTDLVEDVDHAKHPRGGSNH